MVAAPQWRSLPTAGPVTVQAELVARGVHQHYSSSIWLVPWVLFVHIVVVLAPPVRLPLTSSGPKRSTEPAMAATAE